LQRTPPSVFNPVYGDRSAIPLKTADNKKSGIQLKIRNSRLPAVKQRPGNKEIISGAG
jgi:hypothetical protein